ncbi:MAG: AraC family transcriptional regulator [Clostridia bacterium]|nr:AraC family transcriptional regulator [Clostridia bacterium]
MNNISRLQDVIDYIEEHLTEKIDYNVLARIMAVSEQSMQRIFIFITDMSLSEYIKRRRFSRAYEELINSNARIIDLAIKYQYESEISFSKAFKSLFNMTPSEAKKNKVDFVQFPVWQFNDRTEYLYKIKHVEEKEIYAYKSKDAKTKEDLLYRIRELYKELRERNLYNDIYESGMYGVTFKDENEQETYYVGCEKDLGGGEKITIEEGTYLVFDCGGDAQSDIAPLITDIYTQFLKSTSIDIDEYFCFELYQDGNCYLYIKKK